MCATRPVPAHLIGGAVSYPAADDASLSISSWAEHDGYVIAALRGALDIASAPALREQLLSLLRPAASCLIIDLSAVEHADASGLAVLVSSGRRAGLLGGSLRLAAPSPAVAKVLSVTGLNQHLDIFPTVQAACSSPRSPISAPTASKIRGPSRPGIATAGPHR
jgi:anti-sigma B factor antagonist